MSVAEHDRWPVVASRGVIDQYRSGSYTSLKKRLVVTGGEVKLCSMQPMHREIFRVCNLDGTAFPILENVDEAVQSFS